MSAIEHEVASQPPALAAGGRAAAARGAAARARRPRWPVVGCGTSLYMAQAFAAAREAAGHGETDAFAASEFPRGRALRRGAGDLAVGHHHRGAATLLGRGRPRGSPTLAITAVPDSPVAQAAGAAVALPFADERSVVQTRFATTALVLLRAHLGHRHRAGGRRRRARCWPSRCRSTPTGVRPLPVPRPRLDGRARLRGGAEAARGGAGLDRGLPGHGVPARPDRGGRRRARLVWRSARSTTAWPPTSARTGAHPGRPRPPSAGDAGARAPAGGRPRRRPRPRPRRPPQPDPIGGAAMRRRFLLTAILAARHAGRAAAAASARRRSSGGPGPTSPSGTATRTSRARRSRPPPSASTRRHPNIHVTAQNYGNADYALQKVLTAIRGGSIPRHRLPVRLVGGQHRPQPHHRRPDRPLIKDALGRLERLLAGRAPGGAGRRQGRSACRRWSTTWRWSTTRSCSTRPASPTRPPTGPGTTSAPPPSS